MFPFLPIDSLARNGDGLHPKLRAAFNAKPARVAYPDNVVVLADYRSAMMAQSGTGQAAGSARPLPAGVDDPSAVSHGRMISD